ncbi:hypothetical protein QQS21_009907 [Conoideocrella luteorostrata]|uniref:Zn(2)-C6 fungal-type domain-containing protein n=1 Tax=Conoideocrella luteorostrata TaxID=1105319 RepID=A0AAJ0CG15_9HYPO|nr:hypothetical protein QQS21_009907 [Conoideocrella luteorostrata]
MDATPARDIAVKPRQRKWRTKTRTGCMTCRYILTSKTPCPSLSINVRANDGDSFRSVRRVKCDELKPWCRKCTSTGRKCDGYTQLSSGWTAPFLDQQLQYPVAPSNVVANVWDLQAFHLFRSEVVNAMAGPSDEKFWSVDVLQGAHTYPAIWHACLAFTSVHQTYTDDARQLQSKWLGHRERTFTLRHYNNSLKHLMSISSRNGPSYSDKECLLLACVLYTGFCSLAGNFQEALNHACHGLKLFYEWEFWDGARADAASAQPSVFSADALVALINRLDTQLTALLCASERPAWQKKNISLSPSVAPFSSIRKARFEFDALMDGLLEVMQFNGFASNSTQPQPQPFPEARYAYHQAFGLWKTRFNQLTQSLQPQPQSRHEECILTLQIRIATVEIALEVDFVQRELCWDQFVPRFQHIVDLSTKLLETYQAPKTDGVLSYFSFEPAVCEPLYFVASVCRSHSVRREAISLLNRWPRREGIWDAAFAAQVCTAKMNLEEGALSGHCTLAASCQCFPGVQICQGHRVLNTQLQWSAEEATKVTLRTVNDFRQGSKGTTLPILWV